MRDGCNQARKAGKVATSGCNHSFWIILEPFPTLRDGKALFRRESDGRRELGIATEFLRGKHPTARGFRQAFPAARRRVLSPARSSPLRNVFHRRRKVSARPSSLAAMKYVASAHTVNEEVKRMGSSAHERRQTLMVIICSAVTQTCQCSFSSSMPLIHPLHGRVKKLAL